MTARRAAAAFVLAICLGGPLVEIFDQWDPVDVSTSGNDTELSATVAALCVAFAITSAGAILIAMRIRTSHAESRNAIGHGPRLLFATAAPHSRCSRPSVVLRV